MWRMLEMLALWCSKCWRWSKETYVIPVVASVPNLTTCLSCAHMWKHKSESALRLLVAPHLILQSTITVPVHMPYKQYWSLAAISGYGCAIYAESGMVQWKFTKCSAKDNQLQWFSLQWRLVHRLPLVRQWALVDRQCPESEQAGTMVTQAPWYNYK